MRTPLTVELRWKHQYRLIPSEYPPINFFERLVDAEWMAELYYIESLTNDRLRDESGDISLVPAADRICGPGTSPIMAAFTHVSMACPSRFSDGSYGVYYAAKTLATAIAETAFHRAQFLSATQEEPGAIDMRVYIGRVAKPLHDIRSEYYMALHHPDDWAPSQRFGRSLRDKKSWGLIYRSVRDPGGECIAALRPLAVTIPRQGPHFSYVWDGQAITHVYEKKLLK